jgi:hypothetical protein
VWDAWVFLVLPRILLESGFFIFLSIAYLKHSIFTKLFPRSIWAPIHPPERFESRSLASFPCFVLLIAPEARSSFSTFLLNLFSQILFSLYMRQPRKATLQLLRRSLMPLLTTKKSSRQQ